jgi:hypothetical protein
VPLHLRGIGLRDIVEFLQQKGGDQSPLFGKEAVEIGEREEAKLLFALLEGDLRDVLEDQRVEV